MVERFWSESLERGSRKKVWREGLEKGSGEKG